MFFPEHLPCQVLQWCHRSYLLCHPSSAHTLSVLQQNFWGLPVLSALSTRCPGTLWPACFVLSVLFSLHLHYISTHGSFLDGLLFLPCLVCPCLFMVSVFCLPYWSLLLPPSLPKPITSEQFKDF